MVPLGFNPHLLPQQQITRAALCEEYPHYCDVPDPLGTFEAERKHLDTLLHQTFGNLFFDLPRTKKQNPVAGAATGDGPPSIPFRLVSSMLPPRAISLVPPHHDAIPIQRPTEDTPAQMWLRRERAEQVAVDGVSMQPHFQRDSLGAPPVNIFYPTEHQISTFEPPRLLAIERILPSIHSTGAEGMALTGVRCCPVVSVKDLPSSPAVVKKRRKRTKTLRHHPRPQFFRPMQRWGGKSTGYAMGWSGSHPTTSPGPHRYVRDMMRNGILCSQLEQV